MMTDLFRGEKVRLTIESPEVMANAISRWNLDSEYFRLLDTTPGALWSARKIKEWLEKDMEKLPPENYEFGLRTLADNRLIGFVGLGGFQWAHGDCWLGIGIGEREYWSRGYGSDAMRLALRYGFCELDLHRITLGVFEYNQRGRHVYEKVGFSLEGINRQMVLRDGKRSNICIMGILHSEWLSQNPDWSSYGQ
jgi:RimJ/RimL family protein N-acetyltransferase